MISIVISLSLISSVTPEQFGAVGDCVTDDYPAFEQAIAFLSEGTDKRMGGELVLGPTCYRLSNTLDLGKQIRIVGETGDGWGAKTRLIFDAGVPGIIVRLYGGWSSLEHFAMFGKAGMSGAHGVQLEGRAQIKDLRIAGFTGDGVHINCDVNRSPATNCNGWSVEDTIISENGGWGVYTKGGDANAGMALKVDTSQNGAGCIYAGDFLGNTWVAGHCSEGGIKSVDPNARNLFIGQYMEGGPSAVFNLKAPAMRIGGIGGHQTGTGSFLTEGIFAGGWAFMNKKDPNNQVKTAFNTLPGAFVEFEPINGYFPIRLHYGFSEPKTWEWVWANSSVSMQIGDLSSDSKAGQVNFPTGISTGRGIGNKRRIVHNGGKPTSGAWKSGDYVINTDISLSHNECAAFICLASGDFDDPNNHPRFGCVRADVMDQW